MGVTFSFTEGLFELACDGLLRARFDDLTLTAWGERHRLAHGGLEAGSPEPLVSHDEVGAHEVWSFPFVTRSVRQPVRFQLRARCYETEPVVLLELSPGFTQPVWGTEECASLRLRDIPDCQGSVYIHQRVTEYGRDAVGAWWAQARFAPDPTRDNPFDWGLFCLWRAADGRWTALLPMRAGGAVSRLRGEGASEGLSLVASGWCGAHAYPRLPLGLLAFDDTPGAVLDRAFRAASRLCEWSFRLREEKSYPEPLEWLGFGTWGAFGPTVEESLVVEAVSDLENLDRGVRIAWLDEGWQSLDSRRRLTDFGADSQRFPSGLDQLARELQGYGGVRHTGVWLTLQGAWGGIAPDAAIGRPASRLYRGVDGTAVPHPGPEGEGFWRDCFGALQLAYVDLVKIDNQGSGRNLFLGRLPLDDAVGGMIHNVEEAADGSGIDLVGSMGVHVECLYHYASTNVVRVSGDLLPEDKRAAKLHLVHSAHVGAWLSRIAWPDHDAFPTTAPAARAFAVSAALSGGPVILCDRPGHHDIDLIDRLRLRDGRLLLPERPAEPLASRWLDDPLASGQALVVQAPAGRVPRREPSVGLNEPRPQPLAVFVGVFNCALDGQPVTVAIRPDETDVPPAARYAVAAHFSGRRWVVAGDEPVELTLAELEAEILTIAPVRDGRAVLGLLDKLLGACGCYWDDDDLVSLPELGRVLLYDEQQRPPLTIESAPYQEIVDERPLAPRDFRRAGPWLEVRAQSTVFRMSPENGEA